MVTRKSKEPEVKLVKSKATAKTPEKQPVAKKTKAEPKETWPKVVKGNHLTVTTYENGRAELVWDDVALLAEVRAALASVKKSKKTKAK